MLCPAIGWRHSVWSNPFKNSKTHFCAHQFKRHATYCINITIYCHLYWKSSCWWFDSAPGHHFSKYYKWLNFCTLTLCVWDSKTHQTHTFCGVCGMSVWGPTLCPQPSERTQFFMGNRFTISSFLHSAGVSITRDRIHKPYSLQIQFKPWYLWALKQILQLVWFLAPQHLGHLL